jgi:hypothetical protein
MFVKKPVKTKRKKFFISLLKNKKIVLVALAVLCVSVATVIVVYAENSKTVSNKIVNKLTVPHLKGDIKEDFKENTPVGTNVNSKKEVAILNSGNINLFVRVLVIAEVENSEGIQLPANIRKTLPSGETTGQIELLGFDKDNWLDGEDDYFYYSKKLAPKETSKPLFTGIKINGSVLTKDTNPANDAEVYYFSYNDSKLKIVVKEETITSKGDAYQTAWNMKNTQGDFVTPELEEVDKVLEKEKE